MANFLPSTHTRLQSDNQTRRPSEETQSRGKSKNPLLGCYVQSTKGGSSSNKHNNNNNNKPTTGRTRRGVYIYETKAGKGVHD
ncbi:hypothetical protein PTTG_04340 [Puccinia triticina 1-1 BBBD Race 1]|uniref:Uncharacterized protein n=1 Tax=Puccinia triticina (isolate 1-1 / race 1 (BBBD)) TaxID=630390 RepID=A0A180GU43_PUCT1|nr:hypothetical protein PTTG_04340 [Puccinia triticina 1-1 BBBD Race 1]